MNVVVWRFLITINAVSLFILKFWFNHFFEMNVIPMFIHVSKDQIYSMYDFQSKNGFSPFLTHGNWSLSWFASIVILLVTELR